jgi:uroporphyrinogen decarboxylase
MTSRERVWAACRGEPLDRPPISFWGHFYDRESSAAELAAATLEFQRAYGWDWVKLNPRKHYHVEPWGVRYRYGAGPTTKPVLESWPIHRPEDWSITERPADRRALDEQVEAVRRVRQGLDPDVPLIETVFTPLAILGEMTETPDVLKRHMGSHPDRVRRALEAITRMYEGFVAEILAAGAEGIYLATVDWASRDWMSPEEYAAWARPYDLRLLAAAARAPFNVLHVCKPRNLLLELADYPVAAVSWAASDPTNPSLADVRERIARGMMGGISQDDVLQDPSPESALEELRRGFEQTEGRRWLIAPNCSIPPGTPPSNLRAVRAAVEELRVSPSSAR